MSAKVLSFSSRVLKLSLNINPSIVRYGPVRIVKKKYGRELWLVNEDEYCAKIIEVNPGYTSSYHYHKKKKETFIVTQGVCSLVVDDQEIRIQAGGVINILPGIKHRFYVRSSDKRCKILEISMHHDEADVFRLSESGKISHGK